MNFELARRRFLYQSLTGVGGLALADVLRGAAVATNPAGAEDARPHAESEVVHLSDDAGRREPDGFIRSQTGVGEVRQHGDGLEQGEEHRPGEPVCQAAFDSPQRPFPFQKYGQCGRDVSSLFPHTATCVDDMAFVRSIQTENGNHPAAVFLMNTGVVIPGKPSMGSWVTYGLGTENQNLPAFVVLPDFRSLPFSGSQQWGAGFLPASYQGTVLRWKGDPILNLKPPAGVTTEEQSKQMDLLRALQPGLRRDARQQSGSAGTHRRL